MHLSRKLLGKRLFEKLMKMTFYGQFVGGENQAAIKPLIERNRAFGVKAILDYSAEQDLSEEEAKEKVVEESEVVFAENVTTRDGKLAAAAVPKFQPHLEFANRSSNVISAKTYYYESERQCDNHMDIFLKCIDSVSDSTRKEGMAAIKLTALGRPQLLLQISNILVQAQRFFDFMHNPSEVPSLAGKVDKEFFRQRLKNLGVDFAYDDDVQWLSILQKKEEGSADLLAWENLVEARQDLAKIFKVKSLVTGNVEQIVPVLSEEGQEELRQMLHRTDTIVKHAIDREVRVMIDAEQSYFQPAIRRITMELMRKYNKQRNVVFNTYQCYLKSALDMARTDLNLAEKEDFYFGAKLVRGAYMNQERERASSLKYEDPINPTYEATNQMYHNVLDEVFQSISRREKGKIAVMVATHNEDTVRFTVKKMKEYDVYPSDKLICFGQLLGMCDHMSFPLGQKGYSVYKYVPYGAVSEVLPYLGRRACENRGLLDKVRKEKQLLTRELRRRLTSRGERLDFHLRDH
uniref:Proline dehydrogenase n=2 Tax=Macrostomum lignano TaxID=282301 RepID=A0A1I8HJ96_9PLAT